MFPDTCSELHGTQILEPRAWHWRTKASRGAATGQLEPGVRFGSDCILFLGINKLSQRSTKKLTLMVSVISSLQNGGKTQQTKADVVAAIDRPAVVTVDTARAAPATVP